MKEILYEISQEAGQILLNYYGDKTFAVKEDLSPLTLADQASHNSLCKSLKQVKDVPILSEEDVTPYEIRKEWDEFWMIDPLDGTKEFIEGVDEFCINISLIKKQKPILGVIYAPLLREFYFAAVDESFQYRGPERALSAQDSLRAAISRFHNSEKTKEFLELNNIKELETIGAAIKFGRMALGEVDIYPRFEGSKEWDTSAGQIILQKSGSFMIDLITGISPSYNKPSTKNNYFIAGGPRVDFSVLQFSGVQS